MGFRSVKQYAEAWDKGRHHTAFFRKVPFSTNNGYYDMSMYGGGPPANYYASTPLESATLSQLKGIFHGDDKAPSKKYLARISICCDPLSTPGAGNIMLCDYVMYYPFIDMDDLSTQELTNSVTLPRYEDGEGVMVMAVCTSTSVSSGGNFSFEYVNQSGVTKTSPTIYCPPISSLTSSMIVSGSPGQGSATYAPTGAFLALAAGDRGVRQINSVTFAVANGGLLALVLIKPLVNLFHNERNVQIEKEIGSGWSGQVEIKDGAYLNLIRRSQAQSSSLGFTGMIETIWDEGT